MFSPEDMQECPLPNGYKPLIVPNLIDLENAIVAYPFNAYLVGDNPADYLYKATNLLCDFINERYLETSFTLEKNHLISSNDSTGFPLLIDNDVSSFTIAFDFEVSSTINNNTNEQIDIELLT